MTGGLPFVTVGAATKGGGQLAASPDIGFRTAGWYWVTHGLNTLADEGDYRDITLRINGGLNGYSTRIYYYDRALKYIH